MIRFLSLLIVAGLIFTPCAWGTDNSKMVLVPAGTFTLGTSPGKELPSFLSDRTSSQNAQPSQQYEVPAFYIDTYEVTYDDFMRFKPSAKYEHARGDEPIRGVSWFEAEAYCFWLKKRLPTEFEWEKAARGIDRRLYTWGNNFERSQANFGKTVLPIGEIKTDKSPSGVHDMNGNVSEWTSSWYKGYPGNKFEDPNYGKQYKVIRGGAINKREHGFLQEFAALTFRNFAPRKMRSWDTGFRCARSVEK